MKLKKTAFDNLKEFLDYLYRTLYVNYISMSFEFSSIKIKNSLMDFHVYVLPKGFTFKSAEEVNTVMSRCTSLDTYTQIIIGNNIKVNPGITLTPPKRCKGLVIYDKGMLSNFGSISMYARGCIATGQDIYLTQTEFVPAVGSAGGASNTPTYGWSGGNGNNGINGSNRKSGGGGAGAYRYYNSKNNNKNGAGSSGTSYSGGSGGGAGMYNHDDVGGTSSSNPNPISNGGKGGDGSTSEWYFDGIFASGGQGNPSGGASSKGSVSYSIPQDQPEGTGGLLIIYCNNLYNTGNINANGVIAKYVNVTISVTNNHGRSSGAGGSSGGGSLNIFCNRLYDGLSKGTITSNGGASQLNVVNGTENFRGGAGGNGCVTIDATETYTEFEYNDELYNDNEYVEIPEIITEEQNNFNSKYIVHNFLYNGHNHQSFTFEPDTEYTIECWGARGGSDDGDDYPNIVKGSYGNYICAKYITSVSTTADIIIGESGSPGGGGWPDGASSTSEWGVNDPKRFCNKPTAGGSTTLNINNIKSITAKGGNSGTAQLVGTSSNYRTTLDMSLVNDSVKNTLTCNCEINRHSGKFYNVLQKEWKSILIFCSQPSSSTGNHDRITFTWNALTDSSFMEFRIVRPTNQTNRLPELYDAYIYGAGPSGSIWMDCATSTMYAVQIKTSTFASFECSLLDSWDVEYNYPLFYFGSNLTSNDIVENHLVPSYRTWNEGMGVTGPVNSTSTDYISSNIERINISKTIPDIAGYHGMVRISELSKEYIYTSDNDDTIEFTGKQEKLILIPDKLGSRYVNTKFLLECHGAASVSGEKGSLIKSVLAINNPLTLFCKIGEKGNSGYASFNNTYKYFNFDTGTYSVNISAGGNTCISTVDNDNSKKNLLINCNGGSSNYNNVSIVGKTLACNRGSMVYDYVESTKVYCKVNQNLPSNTTIPNNCFPRIAIIIPKEDGVIKFKFTKIDGAAINLYISEPNSAINSGVTNDATLSKEVKKGTTYTLYFRISYYDSGNANGYFSATYPESDVYVYVGNKSTSTDGILTQVFNNYILEPKTVNYIDENYYTPFLNNNKYFLSIISSFHDNSQYCTFTRISARSIICSITNVTSNKLLCVVKRTGNAWYYYCRNVTKGTPKRKWDSSSLTYPGNQEGNVYSWSNGTGTFSWSGGSGYYAAWVSTARDGDPASYEVELSATSDMTEIYIPVNKQMVSVYEILKTQLLNSNIIQEKPEFNNYTSPLLTDVSVSESNRTGNGVIIIKKLPINNDDYILNPDANKVTEMTDEHSIYPSK